MIIRTVVISECKRIYEEIENIEKNLVELKDKFRKLTEGMTKKEFKKFRTDIGLIGGE